MKTKVVAIILAALMITSFITNTVYASSLNDQLYEAQSNLSNAKEHLNDVSGEKQTVAEEVESLSGQISTIDSEIEELQGKIDSLTSSIEIKEKEIKEKEAEILKNQDLLEKRLVAMYKTGGLSYLDVLLGSSNYFDMLSSYDVVKQIADADTKLINKIKDQKDSIEQEKEALASQKQEVALKKKEVDDKAAEIKALKVLKDAKYADLTEEEKKTQEEIDSYNAAIASIDAQIRAAAEAASRQMGENGINFDGSFIWPCSSRLITSTVKWRWGRMHKGIDIGADYEDVYAAASGYAYTEENPSGYGHYIVIFHGDNYVTLYGHLDSYYIYDGQYVYQGQPIACSGNTGSSTGPHLHFEIRQADSFVGFFSASPLNPLDYLPGGYTLMAGAAD